MRAHLIAAAAVVASMAAVPAAAQSSYYVATPVTPPAKASVITRSTLWKCAGATCTAPRAGERVAILCQLAAERLGPLSAFTVSGAPLADDELAKCNARAR